MIIPEIKNMISPDLNRPALPTEPSNCSVFIETTIGPKGLDGEEMFSFMVATPSSLTSETRFRRGRGLLIVPLFSWETVDLALARLLAQCARPSWSEVAQELNKNLRWEFDNYQEVEGQTK